MAEGRHQGGAVRFVLVYLICRSETKYKDRPISETVDEACGGRTRNEGEKNATGAANNDFQPWSIQH